MKSRFFTRLAHRYMKNTRCLKVESFIVKLKKLGLQLRKITGCHKALYAFLWSICPSLALAAEGSLTFTPPPSDVSVVFLGNIFGMVDGVLYGSGSQIMGTLFGIFNAAVLALGGIIIIYTLLVSTLNTAQEGQFLGQKWSSLWVPVRTTFGLALLIPKASGYCLMQIFVMWVILQGVGAADKLWNGALGYLNRGGAIVTANKNPAESLLASMSSGIAGGAQSILAGQVCMLGLQNQLTNQRNTYLKQKQNKSGPCFEPSNPDWKAFCSRSVPDFIGSVNAVSAQMNGTTLMAMPNFSEGVYARLNGICGKVEWNKFAFKENLSTADQNYNALFKNARGFQRETEAAKAQGILSASEIKTAEMSRAIAIQQMYINLAIIARTMVNNDPKLTTRSTANAGAEYSSAAKQQFGIPKTLSGNTCSNPTSEEGCPGWGAISGTVTAPLFSGKEFQGAINAYDAVMRPTLVLQKQLKDAGSSKQARAFINKAKSEGWMMAGSYFFNLVTLNQSALTAGQNAVDTSSGLDKSLSSVKNLIDAFGTTANNCSNSKYSLICEWLNKDQSLANDVVQLISGGPGSGGKDDVIPPVDEPDLSSGKKALLNVVTSKSSSTVYGYTTNSALLRLPGQPGGGASLKFANLMHIKIPATGSKLPNVNFPCGGVSIPFAGEFCVGRMIGTVFYRGIFTTLYNLVGTLTTKLVNEFIFNFVLLPVQAFSSIFGQAVKILSTPGINPIVALAQMGTYYVNFAGEFLLVLLNAGLAVLVPNLVLGGPIWTILIILLLALSLPVLFAWMGVMLSIGMVTAFYTPMVPYIIFTLAAIGWLIAVIEAMVAAPLVALGVTHPEGHEAFGKGEQALMILMNVFLRPSLMILGYIAGIALSYVAIWVLNAGFDNAVSFIQPEQQENNPFIAMNDNSIATGALRETVKSHITASFSSTPLQTEAGTVEGGYTGWAGMFGFFLSIVLYVTLYMIIVHRSFSLIVHLPDKVLRWIGGQPESIGQETAQWGEEAKQKMGEVGKEVSASQAAVSKQATGYAKKGAALAKDAAKTGASVAASAGGAAAGV